MEWTRGQYLVSTDPEHLDLGAIHAYLTRSYWAEGISRELVERSVQGSLCFGLYRLTPLPTEGSPPHAVDDSHALPEPCGLAGPQRAQVGFARVISDRATFAYLGDVYVLEPHRGQGLSKWLMQAVLSHPELQGLRRLVLVTRDAHGLYAPLGFEPLAFPDRYMEIARSGLYKRPPT